jgi:imidazolonepropionase-like amidohydrolase
MGKGSGGEDSNVERKILIGRLIDGTGTKAAENLLMTIKAGRILGMRPVLSSEGAVEDLWMDLSDHTVLPPLYDCHVHLAFFDALKKNLQPSNGKPLDDSPRRRVEKHVQDHIRHGVLGVRDGGDVTGAVLQWKRSLTDPAQSTFRLNAAGPAWFREGRYGKLMGTPVSGDGDAADEIFAGSRTGIDHIKLIQSGLNSLVDYGKQSVPQFTEAEIREIYRRAKKRGLGLMVHANGEEAVAAAISGGCDSIEHGYFMGDENLKKMAAARIAWVPTVIPMKALSEQMLPGSMEADVARRSMEDQMGQISKARQYGVRIVLGTDAGSPGVLHGYSVAEELKLFVDAGCSPEGAIRCATVNAAKLMGGGLPGYLGIGTPASFIVVKGTDPDVVAKIGAVDAVVISGERRLTQYFSP